MNELQPLEFQADFPGISKRMERWWIGESLGRPPFMGSGLLSEPRKVPQAKSLEHKWLDVNYKLDVKEAEFEVSEFVGEWVPYFSIDFGGGLDAGFLGSSYILGEDTVWWHECVEDWGRTAPFVFDPDNKWFQRIRNMLEEACARSKGRYIMGLPTFGGPADTLAAIRGTEALLMDLVENPDEIATRLMQIAEVQIEAMKHFWSILQKYQHGGTNWWPTWGASSSFVAQNDFSIMVSPEMFREILLPSIRMLTDAMPNSIYHLDGPGALRHVEALSEIPNIRAIMYCEGAGNDPIMRWFDELRNIQKCGKAVAQGFPVGAEKEMLANLDPDKMLLLCSAGIGQDIRKVFDNVQNFKSHNMRSH